MLGKVEEEEPEGEALSDRSSGSIVSFENESITYFSLLVRQQYFFSFFHVPIHLQSFILFLLDESTEEEMVLPHSKEEVNVLRSWVEVGGFPAHPEVEAKELLTKVSSYLCSLSPPLLFTSLLA